MFVFLHAFHQGKLIPVDASASDIGALCASDRVTSIVNIKLTHCSDDTILKLVEDAVVFLEVVLLGLTHLSLAALLPVKPWLFWAEGMACQCKHWFLPWHASYNHFFTGHRKKVKKCVWLLYQSLCTCVLVSWIFEAYEAELRLPLLQAFRMGGGGGLCLMSQVKGGEEGGGSSKPVRYLQNSYH